jgi:hypothetical protein
VSAQGRSAGGGRRAWLEPRGPPAHRPPLLLELAVATHLEVAVAPRSMPTRIRRGGHDPLLQMGVAAVAAARPSSASSRRAPLLAELGPPSAFGRRSRDPSTRRGAGRRCRPRHGPPPTPGFPHAQPAAMLHACLCARWGGRGGGEGCRRRGARREVGRTAPDPASPGRRVGGEREEGR